MSVELPTDNIVYLLAELFGENSGKMTVSLEGWRAIKEDPRSAQAFAIVLREAMARHTDDDVIEAISDRLDSAYKLCDLPRKLGDVVSVVESLFPHVGRPNNIEDLILALRDSVSTIEQVVQDIDP